FHDVSWDDYEELLEDLSDRPDIRVAYDRGRLEIMSPLPRHDRYAAFIERLLYFVSDELDLTVEGYGCATWKRKSLRRGAEADACFYIAGAEHVMHKLDIDLETDPPPDIVVEIDITTESSSKFAIYAALEVPEIWRYDDKTMQFSELSAGAYEEIPKSR